MFGFGLGLGLGSQVIGLLSIFLDNAAIFEADSYEFAARTFFATRLLTSYLQSSRVRMTSGNYSVQFPFGLHRSETNANKHVHSSNIHVTFQMLFIHTRHNVFTTYVSQSEFFLNCYSYLYSSGIKTCYRVC